MLEIFTTEGINFSARSANELGAVLLYEYVEGSTKKIRIKLKPNIPLKILIKFNP